MRITHFVRRRPALALLLALGAAVPSACRGADPPETETLRQAEAPAWRYRREYVFIGERAGEPLVIPFTFRATELDSGIQRGMRAWLAQGDRWDDFLDEQWTASEAGGVWRILPRGPLRLAASGALEVESLWYEQGERRLRIELREPISPWQGDDRNRARLLRGRVVLGEESVPGFIAEEYDVRPGPDNAPAGLMREQLVLTGGDSLRLLLSWSERSGATGGRGYAWLGSGGQGGAWEEVEVEWLEARALDEARRDVPVRWRFRVPGADLTGEVHALGFQPELGPQRAGQRAAEARYTVQGWVERGGERTEVHGVARHEQG